MYRLKFKIVLTIFLICFSLEANASGPLLADRSLNAIAQNIAKRSLSESALSTFQRGLPIAIANLGAIGGLSFAESGQNGIFPEEVILNKSSFNEIFHRLNTGVDLNLIKKRKIYLRDAGMEVRNWLTARFYEEDIYFAKVRALCVMINNLTHTIARHMSTGYYFGDHPLVEYFDSTYIFTSIISATIQPESTIYDRWHIKVPEDLVTVKLREATREDAPKLYEIKLAILKSLLEILDRSIKAYFLTIYRESNAGKSYSELWEIIMHPDYAKNQDKPLMGKGSYEFNIIALSTLIDLRNTINVLKAIDSDTIKYALADRLNERNIQLYTEDIIPLLSGLDLDFALGKLLAPSDIIKAMFNLE